MSDNTLRCALVYRLESSGDPVLLAKYDHESAYEDRNSSYADAVGMVVGSDPPGPVSEEGVVGGFKVVQSDMHQIVYGSDSEGLCELPTVSGSFWHRSLVGNPFWTGLQTTVPSERKAPYFSPNLFSPDHLLPFGVAQIHSHFEMRRVIRHRRYHRFEIPVPDGDSDAD